MYRRRRPLNDVMSDSVVVEVKYVSQDDSDNIMRSVPMKRKAADKVYREYIRKGMKCRIVNFSNVANAYTFHKIGNEDRSLMFVRRSQGLYFIIPLR